ncbi:hypothetical protein CL622_05775 [archaeon]|nr:hypothetical protein [archaeon]|tara:strand:- start:455 stop:1021 length:567 start_codon:yes stop_codon:yes gene_type:complete
MFSGKKQSERLDDIEKRVFEQLTKHESILLRIEEQIKKINIEKQLLEEKTTRQISEVVEKYEQDKNSITQLREDLEQEVHAFKVGRTKMVTDGMSSVERVLDEQMDKIKIDADAYNEVCDSIKTVSKTLENVEDEIQKFLTISTTIKKQDFQLTKFTKKIFEADKEKLELMKRIDTLERMVAKMRRHR